PIHTLTPTRHLPAYPRLTLFLSLPPPPTPPYTLSLHDALPISWMPAPATVWPITGCPGSSPATSSPPEVCASASSTRSSSVIPRDRKSTRLNSSHVSISYAVFCLKKKSQRDNVDYKKHEQATNV